jgi:hypothetical protein
VYNIGSGKSVYTLECFEYPTPLTHELSSFIQKCSKSIVKAFVYGWHTESLECFNSHFGSSSCFVCSGKDTWMARITLKYWRLDYIVPPTEQLLMATAAKEQGANAKVAGNRAGHDKKKKSRPKSKFTMADEHEPEERPISLPKDLERALPKLHKSCSRDVYKPFRMARAIPTASSVILSTNSLGDFGKCSIISEILGEPTMFHLCEEAKMIRQRFIHQSQTGRCLVILLFIGETCRALAVQYEKALLYFVHLIKLDVCDLMACNRPQQFILTAHRRAS